MQLVENSRLIDRLGQMPVEAGQFSAPLVFVPAIDAADKILGNKFRLGARLAIYVHTTPFARPASLELAGEFDAGVMGQAFARLHVVALY